MCHFGYVSGEIGSQGLSYVSAYQLSSRSAQISLSMASGAFGIGEQRKGLRSLGVALGDVGESKKYIGRKQLPDPRYQGASSSPAINPCLVRAHQDLPICVRASALAASRDPLS